ncbi:hypothetical protein CQ052_05750 [Ochrobactrum sp. MYb15]|nr:hypothetical protein CQZ90_03140 [Ochrobactrum sp. MYb19]PRA65171.1 hypothetical protein CQ053_09275 [Ochrobactrum sp. MYb18]PRA76860.1 hypothetical protein CQ049_05750 [Brucella thiophenivorans]PRA93506.1 hypothetical protein CQ051_03140 [Ochrobactrum sp. MYb14]PRA98868.1 hypothetical protein CQ052_05750 [Ochrobactrum sp. MYb15]
MTLTPRLFVASTIGKSLGGFSAVKNDILMPKLLASLGFAFFSFIFQFIDQVYLPRSRNV